ncbi:hypothetical protein BZA77DRAFT_339132 [Pyronema omphalodes]|nr:hypothetical protein BZA77DRAFT_339132 [Pyronema omphalodes]
MQLSLTPLLQFILLFLLHVAAASKRGLIFIPALSNSGSTLGNNPGRLSWYYNYHSRPLPNSPTSNLEYVPMLWGAPHPGQDFYADVSSLPQLPRYILGFNEPDMPRSVGGSDISPGHAAALWRQHIQPWAARGVKLGAPAIASTPNGRQWLRDFLGACSGCTIDFLPLHWYGNYKGFREYIWSVEQEYPGMELWLTEVGFPWESEGETRSFFEDVIQYLDSSPAVGKYAWFGSFKVGESNVGPNSAMLDSNGRLTALGQSDIPENEEADRAAK